MTNPIMQLVLGSIFPGFLLTPNIPPTTMIPMTMPTLTKLSALIKTITGILIATLTNKMPIKPPIYKHNFSNMLGCFTHIFYRLNPLASLQLGQHIATMLIDLGCYEKTGPKGQANLHSSVSSTTTSAQKGLSKSYFLSFMISMTLILLIM